MIRLSGTALFACALFLVPAPPCTDAQTVATVDVYFTHSNWDKAARPKHKKDNNEEVPACIRVQGGPWTAAETKRKGSSTWQPMDMKPSLKFKDIEGGMNFAGLFESDRVTLNNDILDNGYADAYRVYREMGVYAPQAYYAIVRLYRVPNTVTGCNAQESDLQLAGGPHRYTVIENVKSESFLNPRFGNCTWAQWESEGKFKVEQASDCPDSGDLFTEDALKNTTEQERLRMQDLGNWHMPSLVNYIATDAIIGHTDGPITRDNNLYVVRSTADLDCSPGSKDAQLCAGGGIYYPIPHGMDQSLVCEDKNMMEHWLKSAARHMPVAKCGADPICRERVNHAYARGLESAHRTNPDCYGFQYWVYLIAVVLVVLLACLPFGFVPHRVSRAHRMPAWLFWLDVTLRLGVVAMLILIWFPVPVFESGDRSPLVHFYVERNAEFPAVRNNIPVLVSSADFDLVSDWQGSLERMAWTSALRYNGRVDTRWYYDQDFEMNINNLFPDEIKRDEYDYDQSFGERSSIREYAPACTTRNACCMVHRFYLGTNIAVFVLFLHTSLITAFRSGRMLGGGGVWAWLGIGSPFMVAFKTLIFFAHFLGVLFYYTRNMQGYYCQGHTYDDFGDRATVHYGALFILAVVVSILLLADAVYEVCVGAVGGAKPRPKTKTGQDAPVSIYYRPLSFLDSF